MNVRDAAAISANIVSAYEQRAISGFEASRRLALLQEQLDVGDPKAWFLADVVRDNLERIAFREGKLPYPYGKQAA